MNNVTISVAVENGDRDDSTLPVPTNDDQAEFTDQDNRTTTELPSRSWINCYKIKNIYRLYIHFFSYNINIIIYKKLKYITF